MSTKIETFTVLGRADAQSTIWLSPTLGFGKSNLKKWNAMIEQLSSYSMKWEMLEKPHGVCIRSTSTERVTSPLSDAGLTSAPVSYPSGYPIGTLLILHALSNMMRIGLALWNNSRTAMCTTLGIPLETYTSLKDPVLLFSVTISQTTEGISVRIEFLK